MPKATLDVINRLLRQPFGVEHNLEGIAKTVQQFLVDNKDPTAGPKYNSIKAVDDMRAVLATLENENLSKSPFLVLLLKVLKVLLRKPVNRAALGRHGVCILTSLMSSACVDAITCECANVVLNMCYDGKNVAHFLEVGGMKALVPLIFSGSEHLQASGLGALQSICFGMTGRDATRDSGVIGAVVRLLDHSSPRVRERALGTVHNLSTDARSIGIIRDEGGLPRLVRLLRCHEGQVCGGAAGTLQNVSREEKSRALLTKSGAVEPLADLLVGKHVKSQTSAAGALVNIVGPDLQGKRDRNLLRGVLTDGIVLGVLQSCMQ